MFGADGGLIIHHISARTSIVELRAAVYIQAPPIRG
jgi:hypothetical protein